MLSNLMRGLGPQRDEEGQRSPINPLKRVATGVNDFATGLSGMMQGLEMDFRPTDTGMMETGNNPWNLSMRQPGQSVGEFLLQQAFAPFAGNTAPDIQRRTGQSRGDPDYSNVDLSNGMDLLNAMKSQGLYNLQQQQNMQNRRQQAEQAAADFPAQLKAFQDR